MRLCGSIRSPAPGGCLLVSCLALAAVAYPGGASTVLFDFESEADFQAMHDEGKAGLGPGKELKVVERFATSGRHALKFSTPAWKTGMPQWPAFECQPPVTNWSGFDRLHLEITNPGERSQTLCLFVSDSKIPTRKGLAQSITLPAFSYSPVSISLDQFAEKGVNPSDIRVMHFFTTEPPGDMAVYLDRILLLEKGESAPSVSTSFLREFAALHEGRALALSEAIEAARHRVQGSISISFTLSNWAASAFGDLNERVLIYRAALARADKEVLSANLNIASIEGEIKQLESLARLRADFEPVRRTVQLAGNARTDLYVGFATSMEKILPRSQEVSASTTNRVVISLARNERESFQLLVLPCERELKNVQLRVTNLHSAKGSVFPATNISCAPVGYVQTRSTPPYGSSCVGWWPDPILDFLKTATIAKGDLQSFWVRLHAPSNQPAGLYSGKLELLIDGGPVFAFDLGVRVYAFSVPIASPLPLAITFSPGTDELPETRERQSVWRQSPDCPVNAWKKHKARWADFLANYYITYDSLYHRGQPDFELLVRLNRQGRLGMFNLGYYDYVGTNSNELAKWKSDHLPRYREAYARAKELGLLSHAYIYGCDEVTTEFFPRVQQAAEILKTEFPEALIMTTTYDQTYGMNSPINAMDAFCPLTPKFDPDQAAKARAAGKQVWWYICCSPHHPNANMFIEYPAIDGRLLMGAMSAKYRPHGFLYYQISIWNSQHPIESGPFTDWDPRSWTTYHGDGSWTCVGPDGTPLPTIRLENFRDGLEDYAYVKN